MRRRPIEMCFTSDFEKRLLMSKVLLLEGTNVFVKQMLCWKDRLKEKEPLDARYELVDRGTDRTLFRIRDVNLFYRGSPVDISDLHKFMQTITAENNLFDIKSLSCESKCLICPNMRLVDVNNLTTTHKCYCLFDYLISRNIEFAFLTDTRFDNSHDDKLASFFWSIQCSREMGPIEWSSY